MRNPNIEILVGLFLIAGLGAFLILVFKVANLDSNGNQDTYTLYANFANVGGLKVRSPVKLGGVVVGRVTDISLDPQKLQPVVQFTVNKRYQQLPETSSISVLTSGLLGEQFLGLTPGFEEDDTSMLVDGDTIEDTHGAIVLEDLIGQLLYSMSKDK